MVPFSFYAIVSNNTLKLGVLFVSVSSWKIYISPRRNVNSRGGNPVMPPVERTFSVQSSYFFALNQTKNQTILWYVCDVKFLNFAANTIILLMIGRFKIKNRDSNRGRLSKKWPKRIVQIIALCWNPLKARYAASTMVVCRKFIPNDIWCCLSLWRLYLSWVSLSLYS